MGSLLRPNLGKTQLSSLFTHKMKFALAAFAALFANVQADVPSAEVIKELGLDPNTVGQTDDMILTEQQHNCFFIPGAPNCTAETRTGFDKSVSSWTQYYNPRQQNYAIPMKVNTATYSAGDLPKIWRSLNWAKNHFKQHTNIDIQFIDDFEQNLFFKKGFLAPFNGGDCCSYVGD